MQNFTWFGSLHKAIFDFLKKPSYKLFGTQRIGSLESTANNGFACEDYHKNTLCGI